VAIGERKKTKIERSRDTDTLRPFSFKEKKGLSFFLKMSGNHCKQGKREADNFLLHCRRCIHALIRVLLIAYFNSGCLHITRIREYHVGL
jgi:hypothetical protein